MNMAAAHVFPSYLPAGLDRADDSPRRIATVGGILLELTRTALAANDVDLIIAQNVVDRKAMFPLSGRL
jgi:hypothetical protein